MRHGLYNDSETRFEVEVSFMKNFLFGIVSIWAMVFCSPAVTDAQSTYIQVSATPIATSVPGGQTAPNASMPPPSGHGIYSDYGDSDINRSYSDDEITDFCTEYLAPFAFAPAPFPRPPRGQVLYTITVVNRTGLNRSLVFRLYPNADRNFGDELEEVELPFADGAFVRRSYRVPLQNVRVTIREAVPGGQVYLWKDLGNNVIEVSLSPK